MIPDDTIAAISTPPGTGAIAIVRLSGPDAFAIVEQIFSAGRRTSPPELASHVARYGLIRDPHSGELVDEVVVIPYRAPQTYTGEDLVEVNCHGGPVITAAILDLCLRLGARLARPGEFTQRAFLSGRIDLTQAEAVLDLIQAKTGRQRRMALSALSGVVGEKIGMVRTALLELLTRIVAGIDFPDEIGDAPEHDVATTLAESIGTLEDLARTVRSGRFLREGLRLAIVGRPNAGKSSLLNQLLKFERAIVTEIPGTTRDSLEELLDINGIPVILVDTAGIRHTDDRVELIGIERTRRAVEESDLVLVVADLIEGWGQPEDEIIKMVDTRPFLLVANKLDLVSNGNLQAPAGQRENCIGSLKLSAKTGSGIAELTGAIESWVFRDEGLERQASLNARQTELCLKAVGALRLAEATLAEGRPQDCLSTDLKAAVDALSEISGEAVSEEIIDNVFARFCIGK
jgi:tRNA modification GTPase